MSAQPNKSRLSIGNKGWEDNNAFLSESKLRGNSYQPASEFRQIYGRATGAGTLNNIRSVKK